MSSPNSKKNRITATIEGAQAPPADDWQPPMPLPDALPPVLPFDADLLPAALRGWVLDIANRMQCPPDFPAVGAIVGLSSLIGARAVVQPKARDDWQVTPNLWGQIVGRPGVMKSPALAQALNPLERLQADESERHQAEYEAWEVDCKVSAMRAADREKRAAKLASNDPSAARALLAQKDEATPPVARRYIVNDATMERLGVLLSENPYGLLVSRDELYGLLTCMDKSGQEGARAFYLQGYDGDKGYTFDRIGRGTTRIPRVCLALIGSIQPGRLQEYIRAAVAGGNADDGLLQRFGLTVWPDVKGQFTNIDQWPNPHAKEQAWAVFQRLARLEPMDDDAPRVWRLSSAAQSLFDQWRAPFEQELRGGQCHPALESHLAKYRKLVPALALIFALIDTPDADSIGEPELRRALDWASYLRTHAERMYSAATVPETGCALDLLRKIKAGSLGMSFTPREVVKKGWAGLTGPDAVRKAIDLLTEYDWLRCDVIASNDPHGRGRPSEIYTVNPAALTPENLQDAPASDPAKTAKMVSAVFAGAGQGHIQKNEGASLPTRKPQRPPRNRPASHRPESRMAFPAHRLHTHMACEKFRSPRRTVRQAMTRRIPVTPGTVNAWPTPTRWQSSRRATARRYGYEAPGTAEHGPRCRADPMGRW